MAYEAANSSRGFLRVSCILVETYKAARATSYKALRSQVSDIWWTAHVEAKVFSWKEKMETVVQTLAGRDCFPGTRYHVGTLFIAR